MGLTMDYLMTPMYVGRLPEITLEDDPERPPPERFPADYDLNKLAARRLYGKQLLFREAISPKARYFAKSYYDTVCAATKVFDGRWSVPELDERALIESVLDQDREMEVQRELCAIPSEGLREMVQEYTKLRIMTIYQRYAAYLGEEHAKKLKPVAKDLEECKQSCSLFAQYWRNFADVLIQYGVDPVDAPDLTPAYVKAGEAVLYCSAVTGLEDEVILQTILGHTLFPHSTPTTSNAITFQDTPSPTYSNNWRHLFQEGFDGIIKRGYGGQAATTIHQDIKDLTCLAHGPDNHDSLLLKELVEDVRDLYFECEDDDLDDPEAWSVSDCFNRLSRVLRFGQDVRGIPLAQVRYELREVLDSFI
ncbi:hypothetical protein H2200_003790 [Cladophialophora chaetospira]|uniref:Uncharacterized protein n=1 Tax=Cladophialophora chaetospira TaxID=386627 RepID=A0AA38XEW1_9EURO|nr:hypothetical protein H2200_003790 [Cladophialophora chaetospira]